MTDKIVVLTTCATPGDAERIGRALVEKRLAACVNILPNARSIYRWQGAVEDTTEHLLLIKSSRELFDRVRLELEKLHPYEVPEVVALPIVEGGEAYLTWMNTAMNSVT